MVGSPMVDRSKVRGQTKSNLPVFQAWGFCTELTTLSDINSVLRKQQLVTYMNHLCRTNLQNLCHGLQWMPRVKTPETLQVMGFEWLAVVKAERKPLSWQQEPSALKQLHWLAFGMCEQCRMAQVIAEIKRYKLAILGLSYSRWTKSGYSTLGEKMIHVIRGLQSSWGKEWKST